MNKLIIVSKNKGIVSKEELSNLAENIKKQIDVEVQFSTPKQLGTQVTFHDVIEFWLIVDRLAGTKFGNKVVDSLLELFSEWAKHKLKKENKPRPKSLTIYGPKGEVVRNVTVNENSEESYPEKEKNYKPNPPKESDSEPF